MAISVLTNLQVPYHVWHFLTLFCSTEGNDSVPDLCTQVHISRWVYLQQNSSENVLIRGKNTIWTRDKITIYIFIFFLNQTLNICYLCAHINVNLQTRGTDSKVFRFWKKCVLDTPLQKHSIHAEEEWSGIFVS